MGRLKVGVTFDQEIPNFSKEEMDPLIQEIAGKITLDAKKNIRNRTSYTGARFQPLAKKTIQNKIRNKSSTPTIPLMDTGLLLNAIDTFKLGVAKYASGVRPVGNPARDLIGFIHQEEGANQITRIIRRFLGVSAQTEKWIQLRIKRFISAAEKKSTKKRVRF